MSMTAALQAELAQEAATTRALLALVPADKKDWKPHPKSMALGVLAMHVAEMPMWAPNILLEPAFDMAPPGAEPYKTPGFTTADYAVSIFDEGIRQATAALGKISDASLGETWRFLMGGQELMAMPRGAALRSWVLNHSVHHRAQLGVYLRLLDVPLPGSYGPTADNPNM
jgi:uncharacterized damage-inducible protein DinB